eukprot:7051462-Prymnesium_polylepis.1
MGWCAQIVHSDSYYSRVRRTLYASQTQPSRPPSVQCRVAFSSESPSRGLQPCIAGHVPSCPFGA